MPAHTLLSLIYHLIGVHNRAGGTVSLSHVKAHTISSDHHCVGNSIADHQANVARTHPDRSYPLCLTELPIAALERHLSITDSTSGMAVIDDPRRCAMLLLRASAMTFFFF